MIWNITARFDKLIQKLPTKFQFIRLNKIAPDIRANPNFPGSAGTEYQFFELTIKGSNEIIDLINKIGNFDSLALVTNVQEVYPENENSRKLRAIFDRNGSDKGSFHNYDLIYAGILDKNQKREIAILEIGLGTNNIDVVSNMGRNGRPGASLRSWQEYASNSQIVGCDIDARILFEDDNINTFYLDQTSDESWNTLLNQISPKKFDVVIDDGLHSPIANLRTIFYGLQLLKDDGVLVIEDVAINSIPVFKLLMTSILKRNRCEIVKTKRSHVFLVHN
jgi:hypothetical protein